jgi:pyridoxine 5-phosphate synthase
VPERRDEHISENGLEITLNQEILQSYIKLIHEANIKVCVFINPDLDQLKAAYKVGVDLIEINTSKYASAFSNGKYKKELEDVSNIAKYAVKLNIEVMAGGGLNYMNIIPLAETREIFEFNVSHSFVARATLVGIERATKELKELLK